MDMARLETRVSVCDHEAHCIGIFIYVSYWFHQFHHNTTVFSSLSSTKWALLSEGTEGYRRKASLTTAWPWKQRSGESFNPHTIHGTRIFTYMNG